MVTIEILGIYYMIFVIILIAPNRSVVLPPQFDMQDYEVDLVDTPAEQLTWYSKNPTTGKFYQDTETGDYFKNILGQYIKLNGTYTKGVNNTYYRDPNGEYKKNQNGLYYLYATNTTTSSTTTRKVLNTTTAAYSTFAFAKARDFQNFYMKDLVDNLAPIEMPVNCTYCPRVYIPVCGTDGRSYTNVCKLHCMNRRKKLYEQAQVSYMGICQIFNDPYEY